MPSRGAGGHGGIHVPGGDWVLPWWLDRQRDPASPAYVVGEPTAAETNSTGRTWTVLGTLDGAWRPAVDPAGLLSPGTGRPGIDWWIRSGDDWVQPSRQRAVRQACIDGMPAVETRLRIGGGDVVHRAAAARMAGGVDVVVIEIENATSAPVAVALVVRPFDLLGAVDVRRVDWDADALALSVDGRPLLRFPRPPGDVVLSDGERDVADLLAGSHRATGPVGGIDSPHGRAQAAVVHPVVHTAALRILVLDSPPPRRRWVRWGRRRRKRRSGSTSPADAPAVASVAAGWRAQTERTTRWELPDGPIETAFQTARRQLLVFRTGGAVVPAPYGSPGGDWGTGATVAMALDELGYAAEAGALVAGIGAGQHAGGQIGEDSTAVRSTAAAVVAAAHHWRLHRDVELAEETSTVIAGAVEWLARHRRRDGGADGPTRGLVPPAGGDRWSYLDSAWTLRAFLDAAELLAAAGERGGSADATRLASDLRVDLMDSLDAVSDGNTDVEMPPGPAEPPGEASVAMLAMASPLRVLASDHPRIAATVRAVRSRLGDRPGVHRSDRPRGMSVTDTALLAAVELVRGEPQAVDRIRWLASAASSTGTWPDRLHPRAASGTGGEGHDGRSTAAFVRLVRSMLVGDRSGSTSLDLMRAWPAEWAGQGVEVHDVPTVLGRVSCAVRWHGESPALMWQLDAHPDVDGVTIRAPGLDAEWSTDERTGEALLAPWDENSGPPGGIGGPLDPASSPPEGTHQPEGPDVDPDGSFA